ncbi:MFS general substrate transporter [Mycena sanguinolenta]|uniref:MFS general substrate transporter n=1 Tax=Mycena sanguinolenta TaxID=230812 RepID=A0A8H6XZZ1_9AGAR|nr:MFS general substrate transporter [Mycena sanguinolenta]
MPTERQPLLEEVRDPPEDAEPPSPYYFTVPVAFLAKLCFFISTTTAVEILLEIVCRLYWNSQHGPYSPPPGDRCAHPSVRRYFVMLKSLVVIMESLGGIFMYGPMSRLSGKYGRRSVLIILTIILILGTLCMIGAYRLPAVFTAPLLLAWLVLISITGASQFDLMTVMYVVDTTTATSYQRTSRLSFVMGWAHVSSIPGFAIGGALTTYLQNNTAVCWAVIGIALVLLAYITFILPESFDRTSREKLQAEWLDERVEIGTGYITSALNTFFRPMLLLKPHRNPVTGGWNLRLLWCGIHALFSGLASGYIWTAMVVYLALHLQELQPQFGPDDNSYVLKVGGLSTSLSLVVVTPLAIKFISRFYGAANEDGVDSTNKGAGKMDKHLAIFGWTVDIIAVALLPLARTRVQVIICVAALGASYFRLSAFRSVVAASGDPLRNGEILSAIQTITSFGNALSGVVLGSVLTKSISTFPSLVFLVYSAIASVSVLALCLIKESDRYVPTTLLRYYG